jgi:glycosyltransferase involved in cell wall biosynthesis
VRDPSVTVVIPCYNAEKYIEDAIVSVLRQWYWNKKIIVVDDKSTDRSVEIIKKILVHPQVSLIQHPENKGACAAVETGFLASDSDYTCMLAADDMFISQYHLINQIDYMAMSVMKRDLDWSYDRVIKSGKSMKDSQRIESKWFVHPFLDNILLTLFPRFCCLLMTRRNPVNSSSLIIKTESFRKHRLSWCPQIRSVCDGYLIADMLLKGLRGGATSGDGVFYRTHPDQVSNTVLHREVNKKVNLLILKRILPGILLGYP